MLAPYRIEIKTHKGKLLKLVAYCVIFLLMGIWILVYQPDSGNSLISDPIVKNGAGILGILMGLFGLYFFGKKLFSTNIGVVIDETGITDTSGALSIGTVLWGDIDEIRINTIQASMASRQSMIAISVKNPDDYIDKQESEWTKKILRLNKSESGGLLNISANGLDIKVEALKNLLDQKLDEYQASKVK